MSLRKKSKIEAGSSQLYQVNLILGGGPHYPVGPYAEWAITAFMLELH